VAPATKFVDGVSGVDSIVVLRLMIEGCSQRNLADVGCVVNKGCSPRKRSVMICVVENSLL
jgi:hypothetical protein